MTHAVPTRRFSDLPSLVVRNPPGFAATPRNHPPTESAKSPGRDTQTTAPPPRAVHRQPVPQHRENRSPNRSPSSDSRSEEHTSELQSLMRISYAVFCLKKKKLKHNKHTKSK